MLLTSLWVDGFIQVGLLTNHLNFLYSNCPTCTDFKLKLTVGTGYPMH